VLVLRSLNLQTDAVHIRPATPHDVPLVLRLIRGLAEYERMLDRVTATEEQLAGDLFGERPYCEVVIAEAGGSPTGFALFYLNYSTFRARPGLYLEDLFVLPAYRGRGHGRALLAHLAGIAVARGYGMVEWQVLDWNEPSIGFYRRLGAVLMDEWTTCRLDGEALTRLAG
jgi:ribosomal protein S18 acetylase RimI-like enzyme